MAIVLEDAGIRSGTTADWAATSLVLGEGEIGINTTTREVRIGDGTNVFSALRSADGEQSGVTTLVTGVKVVANTSITTNSRILLTAQSLGTVTAPKALAVTARSAGVSFTITSADNTDTSVVAYSIEEPAS